MTGLLQNVHRWARPVRITVRTESLQSIQIRFPQQIFVVPLIFLSTSKDNWLKQKAQASGSSLVDVMPLSDGGELEAEDGADAIAPDNSFFF